MGHPTGTLLTVRSEVRSPVVRSIGVICAIMIIVFGTGSVSAQTAPPEIPEAQVNELRAIFSLQEPKDMDAGLVRFLATYPDTPLKADVYRARFNSTRRFSQDHEQLWALGNQYVKEVIKLVDAQSAPDLGSPLLAQVYNEIAYEFALRGQYLEGALEYAQQANALATASADRPPSDVPVEQWRGRLGELRGQIMDTIGWIQYRRNALVDADRAITDAVELLPGHSAIRYHSGMIYAAQGRTDQAIDALLTALSLDQPELSARGELERLFKQRYGSQADDELSSQLNRAMKRVETMKRLALVAERLNVEARDFTLNGLNGTSVSLANLKGKVVVINFWATWCPPCREEMPQIELLWQSYQKSQDTVFLIASVDQDKNLVQPYIAENKYTFPVYYADLAAQAYQVVSIPTTFVIDKNGMVQFVHVGYRPDMGQVLGWQIEALRGE